jgi:hypothetical protein
MLRTCVLALADFRWCATSVIMLVLEALSMFIVRDIMMLHIYYIKTHYFVAVMFFERPGAGQGVATLVEAVATLQNFAMHCYVAC